MKAHEGISENDRPGAVLVVGGGIAGMKAALELGEMGVRVHLLERSPSVGGAVARLAKQFPTNACGLCQILPRFSGRRDGAGYCLRTSFHHPNVEVLTNSEVLRVEGKAGDFRVGYRTVATGVRQDLCIQCGECVVACPVLAKDEFEEGLAYRKAIHTLYPNSTPPIYTVDMANCTRCGDCQKACPVGAVELGQRDINGELRVGAVVLALGFEEIDPRAVGAYGYGRYPNVITSLEFERLFSMRGRWGEILRPSDGKAPRRIAFVQCVGSRDSRRGYCSSVCCMYATKEAMVAKEYLPEVDCQVFFMDLRACGKGYEEYYRRAREELGVGYIRCRPSEVRQLSGSGDLRIRYEAEAGNQEARDFDLVVLSLGLQPAAGAGDLASKFGLDLNEYGFAKGNHYSSAETNSPGVFVCGAFAEPKDIPETVVQAGEAAARAAALVAALPAHHDGGVGAITDRGQAGPADLAASGTEAPRGSAEAQESTPAREVADEDPRVGIFLCGCGGSVSRVVGTEQVAAELSPIPSVAWTEVASRLCSGDARGTIQQRIAEHGLNRVVVAACSPRLHEAAFRREVSASGLPAESLHWVNIREQCAWVHAADPAEATAKAGNLIRMAIASARLQSFRQQSGRVVQAGALVIGGGVAGLTAALTLAEQGIETHLVEKSAELGGNFRRIQYTLNDDRPQGLLSSLIEQAERSQYVQIHTGSEVASVSGSAGDFTTRVSTNGHGSNGHGGPEELLLRHGAIVVATGAGVYSPGEYLYGQNPNVLTQIQLEERLSREGAAGASSFVMIQCVGSRDEERPYCSRVCCAHAIKNALKIKELKPKANVYVLYRDIRTDGFRELYYRKAREAGVLFIRYDERQKPVVKGTDGKLGVTVRDPVLDELITIPADVVALSTAVTPNGNAKLAGALGVELGPTGFFGEANAKFRPLDAMRDGIFYCGLAHSPRLTEESISQARGAAARAIALLRRARLEAPPVVSTVNKRWCAGCGLCVSVCPYQARSIDDFTMAAQVDEALCQGCGACATACPSGATQLIGFAAGQMLATVEEATVG